MAYYRQPVWREGKKQRVGLLDEIRGLCALLMVLYHGAYDLVYLFGVSIPAFHWPVLRFLQPFVAGVFIFISGIACRYSRSNLRRGVIALGLGLLLTLGTLLFLPEQAIYFGILHLLGCSMILFGLLRKLLDHLPAFLGMLLCALAFLLLWQVPSGRVGISSLWSLPLPEFLYATPFLFPLGLVGPGFHSADFFPLIPWLFVFLAGAYIGLFFIGGDMPTSFYQTRSRFLSAVGRKALWVYLLHQPVVYGVLWLAFWVWGRLGLG